MMRDRGCSLRRDQACSNRQGYPSGGRLSVMDSPEETRRLSRRISGGPHDGEGPELNLWPRGGGYGLRARWRIYALLGSFWLADGVYQLLATSDTPSGIAFAVLGAFWVLYAFHLRRTSRSS
jgi:hypothetical protein